ncbi:MAG: hypothetical protein PHN44_04250 [Candidatus Marinimicrobia bacterium]|jgi:hypothetical protein|nr:hypothetical protein [Candidatus Neomarinimicrobiota bacterium]
MKKISFLSVFALVLAMLVFVIPAFSQGSWSNDAVTVTGFAGENQGRMITFTCTVDSVDTLTSKTFSLAKYDGNFYTVDTAGAAHFQDVPYAYIASSAAGAPKLTTYLMGSYDETNWFKVDSLYVADTGETLKTGVVSLFNYHVPYYRAVVYGVALNRSDTILDFRFYLYWNLDQRDR